MKQVSIFFLFTFFISMPITSNMAMASNHEKQNWDDFSQIRAGDYVGCFIIGHGIRFVEVLSIDLKNGILRLKKGELGLPKKLDIGRCFTLAKSREEQHKLNFKYGKKQPLYVGDQVFYQERVMFVKRFDIDGQITLEEQSRNKHFRVVPRDLVTLIVDQDPDKKIKRGDCVYFKDQDFGVILDFDEAGNLLVEKSDNGTCFIRAYEYERYTFHNKRNFYLIYKGKKMRLVGETPSYFFIQSQSGKSFKIRSDKDLEIFEE